MRAHGHAFRGTSFLSFPASYMSVAEAPSCWYKPIIAFCMSFCIPRFACLWARISRHLIFIALRMLGCILVAFHAYHAYCTGNEARFVLRVTERVSISKSPTLRITHDGVRFCCRIHMHSSYIELCNSAPRPSCIDVRDWWHEDRGMHIFVKIHCYALFLLSVTAKPRINNSSESGAHFEKHCKQRLIGASQWISARGSPTGTIHHSRAASWPARQFTAFLVNL